MGLAGEVAVAGLAERRARSRGRLLSRWSRPGRDTSSSPWVARVQATASRPNAELNSSSSDAPVSGWMAIVMPFVCPCQESTVDAIRSDSVRPCFSRQAVDGVGGVVDRLVARREDGDERVAGSEPGRSTFVLPLGVPSSL